MNKQIEKHKNGIVAELLAEAYFVGQGYTVSRPISKFSEYDLIVDNGTLKRVQVKSIYWDKSKNRHMLSLVTSHIRGNGRRTNKKYTMSSFDVLCAIESKSRATYLIPIKDIVGMRSMTIYLNDNEKYRVE